MKRKKYKLNIDKDQPCLYCGAPSYCLALCITHYGRFYAGRPMDDPKQNRQFKREELAWAAGLWDGEGSTSFAARRMQDGSVKRYIRLSMGQKADNRQVLDRFHNAIGNIGEVSKPYKVPTGERCDWRIGSFEGCQAVIALLWTWLSPAKRAQAKEILLEQV